MRGKKAPQRILAPDRVYGSPTVTKLINYIMTEGKKTIAEKIVYRALESASKTVEAEPVAVLEQAIDNVAPVMEVRAKRIGGANYQIPYEVTKERRLILALRWMIAAAKAKRGQTMAERLAGELVDAFKGEGAAMKKKEEAHRMAEANRAFAHFARY